MQPTRDLAIILRVVPYQERDRIVTALTEKHGKISALAKNSIQSRRFGGTLDLFAASEWHWNKKPGAELVQLQEALIRRPFDGLRKDFEKLSIASAWTELLLRIAPEDDGSSDLFKLHSNALVALEEMAIEGTREKDLHLLNAYFAKILQWGGSQPQPHACLECLAPLEQMPPEHALTCIISVAGWICADCRSAGTRHARESKEHGFQVSGLSVSPAAIQDFRASLVGPIRQVSQWTQGTRDEHRGLFRFLEALLAFHLPGFDKKQLKSLRFLDVESNLQLRQDRTPQNQFVETRQQNPTGATRLSADRASKL